MVDVLWRLIWIVAALLFLTTLCIADDVGVGLAVDSQKREMVCSQLALHVWLMTNVYHAFL